MEERYELFLKKSAKRKIKLYELMKSYFGELSQNSKDHSYYEIVKKWKKNKKMLEEDIKFSAKLNIVLIIISCISSLFGILLVIFMADIVYLISLINKYSVSYKDYKFLKKALANFSNYDVSITNADRNIIEIELKNYEINDKIKFVDLEIKNIEKVTNLIIYYLKAKEERSLIINQIENDLYFKKYINDSDLVVDELSESNDNYKTNDLQLLLASEIN